jgi:hypothetical protein
VDQEAPDELVGRQRHRLVPSRPLDPIVLVLEGDALLVGGHQPAIGDRDAVGVKLLRARKARSPKIPYDGRWRLSCLSETGVYCSPPGIFTGDRMARAPLKSAVALTRRFEMRFDNGMIERIDAWRAKQPGLPPRAEAVRRLVGHGLKSQGIRNR